MAAQISHDYAACDEVILIGVLKGSFIFLADLARRLRIPRRIDFISVASYGASATSSGVVRLIMDVRVNIEANASPNPRGPKSLGVKTELAFYGGEPAVKVTAVTPGSPAQLAGITVGLLILEANGTPVTSPEVLTGAEQGSRGRLQLQVFDPKDRRERSVQISL